MTKQRGFTLIELMIVVSIIAVLSAIALPSYQRYAGRSQATAALHELTAAKRQYEIKLNEGVTDPSEYTDIAKLGIPLETERCINSAAAPVMDAATGAVRCELKGSPAIATRVVQWSRSSDGAWRCESSLSPEYRPAGCIVL